MASGKKSKQSKQPDPPPLPAADKGKSKGKGKPSAGTASKEAAAEQPNPAKQLFAGWTGKTPVTLLNEFVQKNAGWQRVDYNMHGGPRDLYHCTIRLTKVDKKQPAPIAVAYKPQETSGTPLKYPTALEARHIAATYALHRLRSNTNMHRMLPPLYRSYWGELEEVKKEDGAKGAWKYSDDPFAVKVAREKDVEEREAAREKERERRARAEKGHKEELLKPFLRRRWEEMAEVQMSESNRQSAESVIRAWTTAWDMNRTNGNDKEAHKGEKHQTRGSSDRGEVEKALVKLGFRSVHIAEALKYTHSKQRALDWLCIHVPEDDLPEQFMQQAYRPSMVLVPAAGNGDSKLSRQLAAKRLARSGFPTSVCMATLDQVASSISGNAKDVPSGAVESLAARIMLNKLCKRTQPQQDSTTSTNFDVDGDAKMAIDDEVLSLDAIYAGENRVRRPSAYQISVSIRPQPRKLCAADARLEFWMPPGIRYPEQPPAVTFASDQLPAYLKLHVAKMLDEAINHDGLPVIFEAVSIAEEMVEGWLASPPPLTDLIEEDTESVESEVPARIDGAKHGRKHGRKRRVASSKDNERVREMFARLQLSDKYQEMQRIRDALPAASFKESITKLVGSNQCVVISGATGCGKTTQVPQFILDECLKAGEHASIVCTQPRRISAIGVATRVAEERVEDIALRDGLVGYAVRGESRQGQNTRLLFCTTGVLLRMFVDDPDLEGVTHVICDEVHERSVDSDLLLILLQQCLERKKNRRLKVVLMSATAQCELFAAYFGRKTPVVEIPGRTFPVEDVYVEDFWMAHATHYTDSRGMDPMRAACMVAWDEKYGLASCATSIDFILVASIVSHIHRTSSTSLSVLVFMPGVQEIQKCVDLLCGMESALHVLPLHAGLSASDQRRVFGPPPKQGMRKVVVATNVAETSITINDIGFVIDSGRVKEVRHDQESRISRLQTTFCSQAAATQRRGRAGRIQKGVCYRLYSRLTESRVMPQHTMPEIQRTPLEQVCLQAKALGHADSQAFLNRALDPPDAKSTEAAERLLVAVGACTAVAGPLSSLGRFMADIPVDLRLAKMLVYGAVFGVLESALVLVSLMAADKPLFMAPFEKRDQARSARMRFAREQSDWLADLAAFQECAGKGGGGKSARLFCADNFISPSVVRDVKSNIRMLRECVEHTGLLENSGSEERGDSSMVLKAILFAGLSPNIVRVSMPKQKYQEVIGGTIGVDHEARQVAFHLAYDMRKDRRVFVHPQSTLFTEAQFPVPFVTFFAQSSTNPQRTYLRDATAPGLYALLMFGPELHVDHDSKVIAIGSGGLAVRAWPRIAVLVNHLRGLLDELLRRKLGDPALAIRDHPVVKTIMQLIKTDGL
ncbi:P-loop containing nucleoside triphosphate hydrolase protein [Martensiomyces pterosporus]|nr:P-loop containing nucleoside triphosphate hydrolase protein [Martensiomyces pterosporus]